MKCSIKLAVAGKRYWKHILDNIEAEELTPSEVNSIENYCSNIDLIANCRSELIRDGVTITNSAGTVAPHPSAALLVKLQSLNLKIAKELKLIRATDKSVLTEDDLGFL